MHSNPISRNLLCLSVVGFLFTVTLSAQDIWEPTPGPYGGSIQDIIALDGQTVLTAALYGGLYRSDDAGHHWSPGGLSDQSIYVFHRASASKLLAGCQNEILVSSDNGGSWGPVAASPEGFILSIDDDGGGTFFAAGREGVFRSFDDGEAWGHLDAGTEGSRALCVCVLENDVVLAGFDNAGLRRSTDGGDSWELADPVFDGKHVETIARQGKKLFASVWMKGFYFSPDNGFTWENRSSGVNDLRAKTFLMRDNGDVLAGTYEGEIWKSTDLGSSWTQLQSPGDGEGIQVIREPYPGTLFCASGDDGVYQSTDGGQSWMHSTQGITNIGTTDMLVDGNGTLFVAFRTRHLQKSTDHGDTWQDTDDLYGGRLLGVDASGNIYCARDYRGVFVTSDAGATWNPHGEDLDRPRFFRFAAAPDGHLYAVVRNSPNIHLPPGTSTWQEFGAPLNNAGIGFLHCAGDAVFAYAHNDGVYRSTDGAENWMKCENGLEGTQFSCITGNAHAMFIGTPDAVYRSLDGGASWSSYGPSLEKVPVELEMLQTGELLASFDDGVYILRDGGSEWEEFTDGLPRIFIHDIRQGHEGVVYARTSWHGIYRHFLTPVHVTAPPRPSAVQLETNHPNPFRDMTTIRFSLDREMSVTLLVTDMLGREVACILDAGQFAAGTHAIPFHAASLPAGVYHLRLQTPECSETKKMVLLR